MGKTKEKRSYRVINLDKFFNPKTIAIIGASSNPEKLGYYPLFNCQKFSGKIYPVTLHAKEILGYKCYKALMDIPDQIDLAVIVLPAGGAPHAVRECGWKGIKNVVIYSGGFLEAGRHDLQTEIDNINSKFNMRIIGPNTNGITNFHNDMNIQIQNSNKQNMPKPGGVSFISQSGTVGIWFMEFAAKNGIGMSKYISYGNRSDVDEADLIEYLSKDKDTKIIGLYSEGFLGEKFRNAVDKCNKPIVMIKSGKTKVTQDEIPNHIGTPAGDYFYQFCSKALICDSLFNMFNIIKGLVMLPKPRNLTVGYITNGVGPCILMEDQLSAYPHGQVTKATRSKLRKNLPKHFVVHNNIVDTTGSVTPEDYEKAIELMDKKVGIIVIGLVYQNAWSGDTVNKFINIITNARIKGKPIILLTYGGREVDYINMRVQTANIPVYSEPTDAVEAIRALIYYGSPVIRFGTEAKT